jgi:hypothetical protein
MTAHKCDTLIQNNGFGGQAIHQEEGTMNESLSAIRVLKGRKEKID